jgi:pyridoxal phosphate enzyme (YggS family)
MTEQEYLENLDVVEKRVVSACLRANRTRASVRLVAVSKKQPLDLVRLAWKVGLRDFGENYAQELRDRSGELTDCDGIIWHAIGPIQPKNAKYVAKVAAYFHALDRLEVASELSKRRTLPALPCLIEVNIAGEASKAGLSPGQLPSFLGAVRELPNLTIIGLTAMPPWSEDPENSRPHFRALAQLARDTGLPELSMGTTGDYEVAIEEGATMIRVGTAIFGSRPQDA